MSSYQNFLSDLDKVCKEYHRNPAEITLVAVTKNHTAAESNELISQGIKVIGENRVQEAKQKFPDLLPCERHLIGHLQSNKAHEAVELFDVIESVDSLKLARILNAEAAKLNKILAIFLEVNLVQEEQKFGFTEEELIETFAEIQKLPNLKTEGLMVMGALNDLEKTKAVFKKGAELVKKLELKNFSAGMSNDWKLAIETGATHLRIGSLLFD